MILPIIKYGHPVLRKKGDRIESITPEIKQFIADMLETGDPQIDGFADMLRANNINSSALGRIAEQCRAQAAHRSGSA